MLEEEASHYRIVIADLNRKINGLLHPKDTLVSPRLSTSSSLSAEGFYQVNTSSSSVCPCVCKVQTQRLRFLKYMPSKSWYVVSSLRFNFKFFFLRKLENQPSAHPLQIVNAKLQQERGRNAQLTKILLNIRTDYLEMISNLRKQLSQNGNDRLISSDATKTSNISVATTSGPTSAHEKKLLQPANHQSPIRECNSLLMNYFECEMAELVQIQKYM